MILGVSPDSIESHNKFIDKIDIPFILLSDRDKKVGELYQVFKMKKLFGKTALGLDRSTFLIDKDGNLVKEYRGVKPKGHAQKVLEFAKEIWN